MTPCTYLSASDNRCGLPAIAAWQHDILGLSFLCEGHDQRARHACELDPDLWLVWDRMPLAPSQSVTQPQGASQAVGAVR